MKRAVRVVKASSPLSAWRESLSSTTRPAEPLSYMPATVVVIETLPSVGTSPCSAMDCSPWTSMAGSKSPIEERPPAWPMMVVKVGSTRCVTPAEFSVVRSNSKPVGSSAPAPTPRA